LKGEDAAACELAFLLRVFGKEVVMETRSRLLSSYPQIPESFAELRSRRGGKATRL